MQPYPTTRLIVLGALALCAAVARSSAVAAEPPVEPGLLEFLGSVDSDDRAWHAYLSRSGVSQTGFAQCTAACAATAAPAAPGSAAGSSRPAADPPAAAGTPLPAGARPSGATADGTHRPSPSSVPTHVSSAGDSGSSQTSASSAGAGSAEPAAQPPADSAPPPSQSPPTRVSRS